MQSAFEKEVIRKLLSFRFWMTSHDRAVLIALLLAFIPIPPSSFISLVLSIFNYYLWKQNKLGGHEIRLIHIALVLSVVSSIAAIGMVFVASQLVLATGVKDIASGMRDWLMYIFTTIEHITPFRTHGQAIV